VHIDGEWLTISEVASLLKANQRTIRNWIREGRLRGINFGGQMGWRVNREELHAYLARLQDGSMQQMSGEMTQKAEEC
jgi:excisionase family DNA binding protein